MKPIHALLLCLVLAAPLTAAHAHEGHDEEAAPAASMPSAPRLETSGAGLELVATASGHDLIIYLDRAATNEPVEGAAIEVSGDGIAAVPAEPLGDGVYEIEASWVDEPGAKTLTFAITADGKTDRLEGVLEVAAAEDAEAEAHVAWTQFLLRPQTWGFAAIVALFGFFLSFAFRPVRMASQTTAQPGEGAAGADKAQASLKRVGCLLIAAALLSATWPAESRAHGDDGHDHGGGDHSGEVRSLDAPRRLPDGSVFVPKPSQRLLHIRTEVAQAKAATKGRELIGTVVPDPSSFGQVQAPMDGRIELAKRGTSYIGQHVTDGEVLALLAPTIPVADLGTMQQLTAEVQGKLTIAEQKLARLNRIEGGFVAQKDIEDTRAELEALREQKRVLAPKDAELIELKAPVSGVISVANVRAGQVVTTRDTLFEIVDPERLWIEAISSSEHDTADVVAAHATDADGHVIELSYIGRAPALRQQSLLLQFKVESPHNGLPIGSAVKVIVQHGKPMQGIVVPDSAVVRGANGLPQVWSKVSAETFKALPVRIVPIDGSHVLVVAGIDAASRIVTEGAELINQVR